MGDQIDVDGGILKANRLRTNFVNAVTVQPLCSGVHYFLFVMHRIGDEQWCGIVEDKGQAGSHVSGRRLRAWTYYCGRMMMMGFSRNSLKDGQAALHVHGQALMRLQKPRPRGDVIGMFVNLEKSTLAVDMNGSFQGACSIPKGSFYVLTHVDRRGDHVELQKTDVGEAPDESQRCCLF